MDTLKLPERLTREWVEACGLLARKPTHDIRLDCSALISADSTGLGFIRVLNTKCKTAGFKLVLDGMRSEILSRLSSWGTATKITGTSRKESFFERVGGFTYAGFLEVTTAFSLLAETIYWSTLGLFRKKDFRTGALGEQMYQLGFRAAGIVAMLSFLVGIVLALQAAMQLRPYGGNIFLVPMLTISMVREFGPLLTAVILAGRSGSATAAEIATMGVQEELDALRTMGLNVIQFVVVPKFAAFTMVLPVLAAISAVAGIFGGFLVGAFYADISPTLFWSLFQKALILKDVTAGLLKSIVFSWLIIWIGAYHGFRCSGGAEEVGRETTNAVVTGIFVIILADALFSFIL